MIGQYQQRRAKPSYGCCKAKGHQARNACPQALTLDGLQVPSACSRYPWLSGFGVSETMKGYFHSWVLLASARLRHGQSHAQVTYRVLAGEIDGKQETGRPKPSSAQGGGMVCSCYLGVSDGVDQNGSTPLSDRTFSRWTRVAYETRSMRNINREDG